MTAAIFGLVGVLIGGALNIVNAYLAERRAQKREGRTAARLLLPELIEASRMLMTAKQTNRFPGTDFPRLQWTKHEATLARLLDSGTWDSVSQVYTSLHLFDDERPKFEEEDEPKLALSEATLQAEWEALQGYREAVVELNEDDLAQLR